jgi:hypothetical protein
VPRSSPRIVVENDRAIFVPSVAGLESLTTM